MSVKSGDRVWVYDEGLIALNRIMGFPTDGPAPNNTGTVASDEDGQDIYADSGSVLINFDDGVSAPYPRDAVFRLPDTEPECDGSGSCPARSHIEGCYRSHRVVPDTEGEEG